MISDRFLDHAGISKVQDYGESRAVRIPDRLIEGKGSDDDPNIIELGLPINWYFNTVTDILAISNQHFDEDDFEFVDSNAFSGDSGDYRCVMPAKLFEGYEGRGSPKGKPVISEEVNLPEDGWLHFVFNDEMVSGDGPDSCYVLTENQFDERFEGSDLSGVPRFM